MGWGFRKRKKVLPGVTLNVTHKGLGVRLGTRNAGVSVSSRGARVGASIPGTGVSYSKSLNGPTESNEDFDEEDDTEGRLEYVESSKPSVLRYLWASITLALASIGAIACLLLGLFMLTGPYWIMGLVLLLLALVSAWYFRKALLVFQNP